ncbi:MAG: carboxypeptidase regulatory-like domain-containing protein [Gemmatimonadaceae bacterium]|nr:carboxypeptidase regulatory-like domain-containing protein [Gemmatimonadaceae bacterium]
MHILRLVMAVAGLAGSALLAHGQGVGGQLVGTVRDEKGAALAGVDVRVARTELQSLTDNGGAFQFERVPAGRVIVVSRRLGYRPDSTPVTLRDGTQASLAIVLIEMREELDAVLVTAEMGASGRMREFWARRAGGLGYFITRDDIEKQHAMRTADLFRRVLGVRIVGAPGEPTRLVTSRRAQSISRMAAAGNACPMMIYIDGIPQPSGTYVLDELTPDMLEGIEVYRGPAEAPARFRQADTACGLVLFWTREPPAVKRKR